MNNSDKEELLNKDKGRASKEFKCKNCGGRLVFSPSLQCLVCEFCGSPFDIKFIGHVHERDIDELLEGGGVDTDADVFQCGSCGAKTVINKKDISMSCPFCGNNNVVKMDDIKGLKPQGIVTFKIEKDAAVKNAIAWAKKKLYAPRSFKKKVNAKDVLGLYNPLFTFDAETHSKYRGRLGTRHSETYTDSQGHTHTRTWVTYETIAGTIDKRYDDILIQASEQITQRYLNDIEPFSTNLAISYEPSLLVGYQASNNTKTGNVCWNEAQALIKVSIERAILAKYSYDFVDYLKVDTDYTSKSYKYVLVPLYVGNYHYHKKLYNFYVNGENGKVGGKTPISGLKVFITVLIVLAIIAVVVYFATKYGGN